MEKLNLLVSAMVDGRTNGAFDKALVQKRRHESATACVPFVYEPRNHPRGYLEGGAYITVDPDEVAWPFPVMSFETAGWGPTSFLVPKGDGGVILAIMVDSRARMFGVMDGKPLGTHKVRGVDQVSYESAHLFCGFDSESGRHAAGICAPP